LVILLPIVFTIRQPPNMVPKAIVAWEVRMTQSGTSNVCRRPEATSSPVMMTRPGAMPGGLSSRAWNLRFAGRLEEGHVIPTSCVRVGPNAVDVGPHRDLAGDLVTAVRAGGLKMGFYYSLYEWSRPLYHEDVDRYSLALASVASGAGLIRAAV
jgi:hypothetical protein